MERGGGSTPHPLCIELQVIEFIKDPEGFPLDPSWGVGQCLGAVEWKEEKQTESNVKQKYSKMQMHAQNEVSDVTPTALQWIWL